MKVSDPSSVSGVGIGFFPFLTTNDLERVEVLKGATSVLYGSEGESGAINMLLKEPEEGTHFNLSFSGGSYETFEENIGGSYATDKAGVAISGTRIDSAGIGSDSYYGNTSFSVIGTAKPTDNLKITPIARVIHTYLDLDTNPTLGANGELIPNQRTPEDHAESTSRFFALSTELKPTEQYSTLLNVYFNDVDRNYYYDFSGFKSKYLYGGRSFNTDWQNVLAVDELFSTFVGGLEYEHVSIDNNSDGLIDDAGQDRYAMYLKDRLAFLSDTLFIDFGGRLTYVSSIESWMPTYEASALYNLKYTGTALHSSVSRGFRAPTLYETHGKSVDFAMGGIVDVGNKDLNEEKTLSFDAGITQELFSKDYSIDVTFFNIASDDTIVFDYLNNTHVNAQGGEYQGFETSLTAKPIQNLLLRGAYTYQSKADGLDHNRTQLHPYNIFSLSAMYAVGDLELSLIGRYRGSQDVAFYGASEMYREDSVFLTNAAIGYNVTKELQAFVRVDNLFDEDYTEAGYRMPGVTAFGGFRFTM